MTPYKPETKSLEESMEFFSQGKRCGHVEYDHIYSLEGPVKTTAER
jgi:hypothetical protein